MKVAQSKLLLHYLHNSFYGYFPHKNQVSQ